jgi:hypothetical protein
LELRISGRLARDEENAVAAGRELVDQGVNFGLGADVYAACELVQDQQRTPDGEPFSSARSQCS